MNKYREWFKQYWVSLIPVLILSIISIRQLSLVHFDHLNRWKGGGFGMFSTIAERFVHIHLIDRGSFECANFPSEHMQEISKLKNYPSYQKIEQLLKKIFNQPWVYYTKISQGSNKKGVRMIEPFETIAASDKLANFSSVEVQVYDIKFNPKSGVLRPKLIRKMSYSK